MLNLAADKTFWYFDEKLMLLERLGYGEDGVGDSVGRNALAYICWPNASFLKEGILQCIKMGDDGYLQFYRYPGKYANTMSRDHVGAIILAFYINRDTAELKWVLDNLPWRFSRKHSQTIDFWVWQKALKCGGWKRFGLSQVFYLLVVLQFIFIIPWNRLIRSILGIKPVDLDNDPKFIKWVPGTWRWYLQKTIYPQFAFFLLVWQVKSLSASWFKSMLQKFLLLESGNIVISTVLGNRLTRKDIDEYKPTMPFVWSGRLDNSTDVQLRRMNDAESEFNDLNRGMLDYLYYRIDWIMENCDDKIVESIKRGREIVRY